MNSWPEPVVQVAMAAPTGAMDIEQIALEPLEQLPSPSRLASTSRQTFPEPYVPNPQETVRVSSLIVGSNTSLDEQPILLQPGDLTASGKVTAQGYQIMSDRQLKDEILPLDIDAVAILRQLKIVQYKYKNDAQERPQIGVVAQDVAQVWADVVDDDSATGLKSVRLDLLYFATMRALQHFLPLLTELDKQHRLGLPLLMHAQQRAAAQQAIKPCQDSLSARVQCSDAMSDSDSGSETHVSAIGNLGIEHSIDSSGCHPKANQASVSSELPGFKDDAAMVAHILAALKEENEGMPVVVRKLLNKLGRESVWSTFQEAQYTTLPAADGKARSPGSTFLHLLKRQEQQAKIA